MYQINVNFGTGRQIARGLRDDFLGSTAEIRPMDAAECIPTGSHRFVASCVKGSSFYYVFAESDRGGQF